MRHCLYLYTLPVLPVCHWRSNVLRHRVSRCRCNFTDADLLQPGGSLQAFDLLDISARISMAGVANVASGDIQANRVTVNTKNVSAIALTP